MLERTIRILAVVCVAVLLGAPANPAAGQTGEFLCSAGSRDGLPCDSFDDCPNGACVIAQGICSDGFICDCPSSSCSNSQACEDDPSFGTCVGGVSPGLCCDVANNCLGNDPCVGAHKVCVGGQDQGFSCTVSSQCRNGQCQSTGCYCDGGDFDGYTCVTTADCPSGRCDCSSVAVPTATPPTVIPTAVRTNTPIRTSTPVTPGATVRPTSPVPTATTGPGTPLPTSTRANSPTPVFSPTPVIGVLAVTLTATLPGSDKIRLDSDPRDLPTRGVVEVFGQMLPFTRRVSSQILDIQNEFGVPFAVPVGSTVRLIEYTPTPGPNNVGYEAQAEGCAISPTGANGGQALPLLVVGLIGGLLRRRRSRAVR